VNQAVTVAEDIISDYFKLTISAWKKYRYEIVTFKDLKDSEIANAAFAQIIRYSRPIHPKACDKVILPYLLAGSQHSHCLEPRIRV
jgi:hypothetical protein